MHTSNRALPGSPARHLQDGRAGSQPPSFVSPNSLSQDSEAAYWTNMDDDEVFSHLPDADATTRTPASSDLSNLHLKPAFILDKESDTVDIDQRYVPVVTASSNFCAYVVFNGVVNGPFFNWASAKLSITSLGNLSINKGYRSIKSAQEAWEKFLEKGLMPPGMMGPSVAALLAASRMRDTFYQDLATRQQVPRTPTQTSARQRTPAPPMLPAIHRTPPSKSPAIHRLPPVPALTPSTPLRHPAANIIDVPSPYLSPAVAKYLVVLDGKRPGVYRQHDPEVPSSIGSAIIDGLANADRHFVTQFMLGNVHRRAT